MKILMFSDEFPPLGNRKAAFAHNLLCELSKKGNAVEIDLITASRSLPKKEMILDNIVVHYIDVGRNCTDSKLTYFEKWCFSLKGKQYAKQLMKKKKYDLIHYLGLFFYRFIPLKKNIPSLVNIFSAELYEKCFFRKKAFFLNNVYRMKALVVSCQEDYETIKKWAPNRELSLIYSGVEVKKSFFPFRIVQNKKFTILSVGPLSDKGEYDFLIRGLKGIPNCRLIIIGDGILQEKLSRLAIENKVDVKFCGRMGYGEVQEAMRRSDLYISVGKNYGISHSMLEAMAHGLPVICTDVGGNKEMIKENGFVIRSRNLTDLQNALKSYQESPALLKKQGKLSKRIIEELNGKKMAASYLKIYKDLAGV